MTNYYLFLLSFMVISSLVFSSQSFEKDLINTSKGQVEVTFVGHASLIVKYNEIVIHIDPYSVLADYDNLPKADIILITHHHADHFDPKAINAIRKESTVVFLTEICHNQLKYAKIMKNGDAVLFENIKLEAIPAYNIIHKRDNGEVYHKKGEGNGYILTFGDVRILIAGDTENIPEIKELAHIDYAFLPMNTPYTMTPEMVVDAVTAFRPKVLYPYHFHYGETDIDELLDLLKDFKDIKVRIRNREQ